MCGAVMSTQIDELNRKQREVTWLLKELFRACISCTFPVTWRRLRDEHVLVQRSKQSQPLNPPIMTPIIRRYPRPGRIFGDLLLFCIVHVEMRNLHVWMGRDKYTSSVQ